MEENMEENRGKSNQINEKMTKTKRWRRGYGITAILITRRAIIGGKQIQSGKRKPEISK